MKISKADQAKLTARLNQFRAQAPRLSGDDTREALIEILDALTKGGEGDDDKKD